MLIFAPGIYSHTFGVSEFGDDDAHGDDLVAGEAVLGETDFGLTLSISAVHMSFAMCTMYMFHVLRHVDLSLRRSFSPQSAMFHVSL